VTKQGQRVDLCPKHYVEARLEADKDKPRAEKSNPDLRKRSPQFEPGDREKWLENNQRLVTTVRIQPNGWTATELMRALMLPQQSVVARLRIGVLLGVFRKEQDPGGMRAARYFLASAS
jgi:hypothetical protein